LSDVGPKDIKRESRVRDDLWYILDKADGIRCGVYSSCQLRIKGDWCLDDHEEYWEARSKFIDSDECSGYLSILSSIVYACQKINRLFALVFGLANSYLSTLDDSCLPIPNDLITHDFDGKPIEVRYIPLKAFHGSVWRLKDVWLIQLNSNDCSARQRFTLYHEIFHILAHSRCNPVFKKLDNDRKGRLSEMLADRFSTAILLPGNLVTKVWPTVQDTSQLAKLFEVPQPIALLTVKSLKLI
jgi:hypothetical protein